MDPVWLRQCVSAEGRVKAVHETIMLACSMFAICRHLAQSNCLNPGIVIDNKEFHALSFKCSHTTVQSADEYAKATNGNTPFTR